MDLHATEEGLWVVLILVHSRLWEPVIIVIRITTQMNQVYIHAHLSQEPAYNAHIAEAVSH